MAAIGSGSRGGFPPSADWSCSRFTYTWPHMVDRAIGSGSTDFQYLACTGATSQDIERQAKNLKGDLDVVMLTAGVERRKKFNKLVENINKAIQEVVKEYQEASNKKFDIDFSDWSAWPAEVDGQMCSPSSDGHYPDPNQPELQFIKDNTWVRDVRVRDSLKKRRYDSWHDVSFDQGLAATNKVKDAQSASVSALRDAEDRALKMDMYESILFKSQSPEAIARKRLDKRALSPPGCPGSYMPSPGLPDIFARIFHPNEKGHETIASFAIETLAYAKEAQDGKAGGMCRVNDEFVCWRAQENRKAFASWERLNKKYRDFCEDVEPPQDTINWKWEKTYDKGTPDETQFVVHLSNEASAFDRSQCFESFDLILNSCDGNDPENPMNWKFGGKYVRGSYRYEINPQRERELIRRTDGSCQGWYKGFNGAYTIYGKGWANWDWGQESLLTAARGCVGVVSSWKFDYFDSPGDHDGWEWRATFSTPIWVRARCFNNLKVQAAAGGYTDHSKKKISAESYENFGCSGND
ncbi:hypothetical protein HIM_07838 [Hirsutella minnesotensis 3608]|uniref:Uncharacterized protein n=1 Tax=Hirsutella minnesotensis 3608 TaxID=1043627 RepID=A0A0F7ZTA3_9HYPO|nr:hypothetical protein HIM_07838 [Hirsutella minnesotensis 3608]